MPTDPTATAAEQMSVVMCRPTGDLQAAIDQAIDALGEARRFIHAECPHAATERELRRVADMLSQAMERTDVQTQNP